MIATSDQYLTTSRYAIEIAYWKNLKKAGATNSQITPAVNN